MTTKDSYDYIKNKIQSMKNTYPSLRKKTDDYVFSALCVKSHLYKNPSLQLSESDIAEMIVDGPYDGGVDVLLTDPSSESSDLIIAQSKYYTSINSDDVFNSLVKMASFYKDMQQGHYEQVNTTVQGRFLTLFSEIAEESKIHFVFYTSAPQSKIKKENLEKKFRELFTDSSQFEVSILFDEDIIEEIKEADSRKSTVEDGKLKIDSADNYLLYGDNAAIVNVSALSIKTLYAQYTIQLLARNLRYHIAGRDIDRGIEETIRKSPNSFWQKNNGITIVCDDFDIDGKEVKLRNFSIINGGQTTYMIGKSKYIDDTHDFFLPCKIIQADGNTEDEKIDFCLEIAKATNTQKPIKKIDLKSNSKEQVLFAQAMRAAELFYQTKRGETVPEKFNEPYLNSSLVDIGKLCLAAIFQIPCTSRTKPSTLYLPQYYNKIFDSNQVQIANLSKELLYINYYFKNSYQKNFDKENENKPMAKERIAFAHNARTICIAFVAFASRYYYGNISNAAIDDINKFARSDNPAISQYYDTFSNIDNVKFFIPTANFNQKDEYKKILNDLFNVIIECGITSFSMASAMSGADTPLNATNYLKKDKNYYTILSVNWPMISSRINEIFGRLK